MTTVNPFCWLLGARVFSQWSSDGLPQENGETSWRAFRSSGAESEDPVIDSPTAPLLALEAAGEDRQTAEEAIRDRLAGQSSTQASEVSGGKLIKGISTLGWAFRIDADLTLDGREEHASAVIRMTGDPLRPYYTLWRQELAK